MGQPVRVLVVDDSAVCRVALRRALAADGGIAVVGEARSGEEAVREAARLSPDVILMDIVMPGIDGITATRQIMSTCARPVLVISDLIGSAADLGFEALRAGALDVVGKPSAAQLHDAAFLRALCRRVRMIAEVPVVTRRRRVDRAPSGEMPPPELRTRPARERVELVLLGASTGGPPTLARLLTFLPPVPRWPLVVVQHMAPGFIDGMAAWLGRASGHRVALAEDGAPLAPGTIYVAPDHRHLTLQGGRARLLAPRRPSGHCPSVDELFLSVAEGGDADTVVAAVLTGMGRDGAAGLAALRAAGAWTVAQDAASSVVHGMPRAAEEAGAACEVLSADQLGTWLASLACPSPPALSVRDRGHRH